MNEIEIVTVKTEIGRDTWRGTWFSIDSIGSLIIHKIGDAGLIRAAYAPGQWRYAESSYYYEEED